MKTLSQLASKEIKIFMRTYWKYYYICTIFGEIRKYHCAKHARMMTKIG